MFRSSEHYKELERIRNQSEKYKLKKKQYNENHKEALSVYFKERRLKNLEAVRESDRERWHHGGKKERTKEWYNKNHDVVLEKAKLYRIAHRDQILKNALVYAKKNHDRVLIWKRNYYANHREGILEKQKQNPEQYREAARAWRTKNKERYLETRRRYKKSEKGRVYVYRSNYRRRRLLGYSPINKKFKDADFHHLHLNMDVGMDHSIGIYIPTELHKSIFHSWKTGTGMREINKLALDWLATQSTI